MKLQYKLGILTLGFLAFTSCEKNDPFADHLLIGQRVPTCYWEVGSTTAKSGGYFSFIGKYYTEDGHTPSHSEVWYNIVSSEDGEVTSKLAGTGFKINKSFSVEDTVRIMQCIKSYPHSLANWNGYEFVLIDSVPVSETLVPVNWIAPQKWSEDEVDKLNIYFPKGFDTEFKNELDSLILLDTYYTSLRQLYINYQKFTNEVFAAVNEEFGTKFPTDIKYSEKDDGSTQKSDIWIDYDNPYDKNKKDDKVPPAKVVEYYYTTQDESGKNVDIKVDTLDVDVVSDVNNEAYLKGTSTRVYKVYESAPWVYSRYIDDLGSVKSTVIPEYIPAFAKLVKIIPFEDWIYSSADGYAISFKRKYMLNSLYKVVDTEDNVGVCHTSYSIEIN